MKRVKLSDLDPGRGERKISRRGTRLQSISPNRPGKWSEVAALLDTLKLDQAVPYEILPGEDPKRVLYAARSFIRRKRDCWPGYRVWADLSNDGSRIYFFKDEI